MNEQQHPQSLLPHVSLDIGGTLTKCTFAATQQPILVDFELLTHLTILNGLQNYSVYFISLPNNIDKLVALLTQLGFLGTPQVLTKIYITGGGAFKYQDQLSQLATLVKVNEFESLAKGFKFLDTFKPKETFFTYNNGIQHLQLTQTIFPFIMVQIGSGVSIVEFKSHSDFQRISGTSLGGGMFLGLCHLYTGINDFDQLLQMTKIGSNATTDLLINEVHLGASSPVRNKNEAQVAVSLGKLQNKHPKKQEDLVKSLLYMTTYNLSQIAFMHSKLHNIERVFFSGHFIRNHTETLECIVEAFDYFSKLDGHHRYPYFITHDGFMGSLGTFAAATNDLGVYN